MQSSTSTSSELGPIGPIAVHKQMPQRSQVSLLSGPHHALREFFPRAAATAAALAGSNASYTYLTHSWLVRLFLDCSPRLGIACPSPAEVTAFRAAVGAGSITWHALPHNGEVCTQGWGGGGQRLRGLNAQGTSSKTRGTAPSESAGACVAGGALRRGPARFCRAIHARAGSGERGRAVIAAVGKAALPAALWPRPLPSSLTQSCACIALCFAVLCAALQGHRQSARRAGAHTGRGTRARAPGSAGHFGRRQWRLRAAGRAPQRALPLAGHRQRHAAARILAPGWGRVGQSLGGAAQELLGPPVNGLLPPSLFSFSLKPLLSCSAAHCHAFPPSPRWLQRRASGWGQ